VIVVVTAGSTSTIRSRSYAQWLPADRVARAVSYEGTERPLRFTGEAQSE